MSAENNVPAIRFKGFSGGWEEKKLETIFNKIRNAFVGTATPYYVKSGNFYLESNNVKNGKINRNTEVFINDEFYQKQSDKWLRTGDIVMVQSGHVGHTAVIPPELNNIAAHALIMFTDTKEEINPHFLNFQFQTIKSKNRLSEITTGNTIKHILSSEMKEFYASFPHFKEQNIVGNYFQQLDTLSTQHQKKHDKLLNLKKALLEKIFPKQGATVPEIRFKGFSGEWEEMEFKELAEVRRGLTYKPSDIEKDGVKVLRSSNINVDRFVLREDDVHVNKNAINIKLIEKGDILITSANGSSHLVGKHAVVSDLDKETVHGGFMLVASTQRPFFLNASMSTVWYERFLSMHVAGGNGAIGNLKASTLEKQNILIPKDEEQAKIGNLFKHLDKLITQHQAQLNKLNNIKQACLEKMFV